MEQQNTMPHKERMFSRAFSFKGRIKRAEFVWSYIITWLAGNIISLFAETIMINPEYPTLSDVIMVYIFLGPVLWFYFAQRIKRCHDIGRNGWWQLIPFYTLWLLFQISDGDNKYGPAIVKTEKKNISTIVEQTDNNKFLYGSSIIAVTIYLSIILLSCQISSMMKVVIGIIVLFVIGTILFIGYRKSKAL